jgi:hypothetical protein
MALYHLATNKLIKHNFSKGKMSAVKGLVVHVAQSTTLGGVFSWFNNPKQKVKNNGVDVHISVSAHFGIDTDGTVWQFVDTDDMAFAQGPGNSSWISVENVGFSGNSLTEAQIASAGNLFFWINETYSVPLSLANSSADSGLAYHSIDPSWGHPHCPGDQ